MEELVAIEYREKDWASVRELAHRVSVVADAGVDKGLVSVELPGLLLGGVETPSWAEKPAVLFGLRARTVEAVVAFGAALSQRGFTGVYTWCENAPQPVWRREVEALLAGFGLLYGRGGRRQLYGRSPAEIRAALKEEVKTEDSVVGTNIWMPAPDRYGRAVDGLVVEEADRRGVDWIWIPGTGINPGSVEDDDEQRARVVEARRDDGRLTPDEFAGWAVGDRLERGKVRLSDVAQKPRRWFRELTGWEKR